MSGPDARPRLLPDLLRLAAATVPDREVLHVDGAGGLVCCDWEARSNRAARALADLGVRAGDRVALVFRAEEQLDWAVAYFAALKAGAVAATLPVLDPDELRAGLDELRPSATVCGGGAATEGVHLEELERERDASPFQVPVEDRAAAQIVYTSGTTGPPRAVVASHRNVLAFFGAPPLPTADAGEVLVHAMPIGGNPSHTALLGSLMRGAAVVQPSFEPARMTQLVRRFGAHVLFLLPGMAVELLRCGSDSLDELSPLELVLLTGAAAPPALLERVSHALPRARIVDTYTSTEAFPASAGGIYDPSRPAAVGRPANGSEVSVVGADGEPLRSGRAGAIRLRRRDAPPRTLLVAGDERPLDIDGWIDTGDVGCVDADGYLYVLDRAADLVETRAGVVPTLELEAALADHPDVVEAACVGRPEDGLGDTVAAAVRVSRALTAAELRSFLAERVPQHAVPREIVFAETLPRTRAFKPDKRRLRDDLCPPGGTVGPSGGRARPIAVRALGSRIGERSSASPGPPATFVDCHTHVVPSGDDGAQSLAEGEALCAEAWRFGTRLLFATPHVWPGLPLTRRREETVRSAYEALAAVVPLELRLGFEVTPCEDVSREDPARFVLEGTRYVLVDTPPGPLDDLIVLASRVEAAGLSPLVAHPERSERLQRERQLADELADRFALQVNVSSLLGGHGPAAERLAWHLAATARACVVASDGHSATRPARLDLGYGLLRRRLGEERALRLVDGSVLGAGVAAPAALVPAP